MVFPILLDLRLEEGVIASLFKKIRLLDSRQVDNPWFIKESGEVQGCRIRATTLTSKEILGFGVN